MLLCVAGASLQTINAATITVTNLSDSGPGSLRQALADANDRDRIEFAVTGSIRLTSGELHVDKSVTIAGPGAHQLTVDGNARWQVFHIGPDVRVRISALTITNGLAGSGAGIFNDLSDLAVRDCIVNGNRGTYGGGIFVDSMRGTAYLTIENSSITGNSVTGAGGGIYIRSTYHSTSVELNNSTVSGNSAQLHGGGGIYINSGPHSEFTSAHLIVRNSTFSGNSSPRESGGGIWIATFDRGVTFLDVSNSTFSGNSAGGHGGGIYCFGQYLAGGVLHVSTSTFSGNSAMLGLFGGTIYTNRTLYISNTILRAGTGGSILATSGSRSYGCNLSSDDGGNLLRSPGDQINIDPKLGPLQDNGGATYTHALLAGSPAIDAGCGPTVPFPWPDYDQRGPGYSRLVNGRNDIGAFEVQTAVPTPTPTPRS